MRKEAEQQFEKKLAKVEEKINGVHEKLQEVVGEMKGARLARSKGNGAELGQGDRVDFAGRGTRHQKG